MLPTRTVERAFRPLYGQPLNFVAFGKAVKKLDDWYQQRGILGQVGVGEGQVRVRLGQIEASWYEAASSRDVTCKGLVTAWHTWQGKQWLTKSSTRVLERPWLDCCCVC
jgi:hypothetical protein